MNWNQPICERCWFTENPERMPVRAAVFHDITDRPDTAEQCCMCGWPTVARIFIRRHPDECNYPSPE